MQGPPEAPSSAPNVGPDGSGDWESSRCLGKSRDDRRDGAARRPAGVPFLKICILIARNRPRKSSRVASRCPLCSKSGKFFLGLCPSGRGKGMGICRSHESVPYSSGPPFQRGQDLEKGTDFRRIHRGPTSGSPGLRPGIPTVDPTDANRV